MKEQWKHQLIKGKEKDIEKEFLMNRLKLAGFHPLSKKIDGSNVKVMWRVR